jgi:WhiB family redox-sensing transcriptional regulator
VFLSTTTASTYSLPSGGFLIPEASKSLKPTHDNWDWQLDGACRGLPSEMFFHPDGERRRHRSSRESEAKAVCAICLVIDACRSHALEVPEVYGIWGGLGEEDRANLLRKRLALVI